MRLLLLNLKYRRTLGEAIEKDAVLTVFFHAIWSTMSIVMYYCFWSVFKLVCVNLYIVLKLYKSKNLRKLISKHYALKESESPFLEP